MGELLAEEVVLNLLYLLLHILSTPRHATVTLTHPQWQDILVDLDLEQVVHLVPNHSQHRHLPTCPLTNKEITLVSSFSNVSKIHTLTTLPRSLECCWRWTLLNS